MSHEQKLFDDETVARAADAGLADDIPFGDDPQLPEVDRSTAELYSVCPLQARMIEDGMRPAVGQLAEVGNEVHAAFSEAITAYIELTSDISGRIYPSMIVDTVKARLMHSRPDLQPEVMQAAMPSIWTWANMLFEIIAPEILKYDGGEGDMKGQLGWEIPSLGVQFTSEVDLLCATASPTVLREIDYKSGWRKHSESSIAESFQFESHAALILHNFPTIQAVDISVLNTRRGGLTEPVRFVRDRLPQYQARIVETLTARKQNLELPLSQVAIWPSIEKCRICDVARHCRITPSTACAKDPVAFVTELVALEAKAEAMRVEAAGYVDATDADIVLPDGTAFGRRKPAAEKKKPAAFYTIKGE